MYVDKYNKAVMAALFSPALNPAGFVADQLVYIPAEEQKKRSAGKYKEIVNTRLITWHCIDGSVVHAATKKAAIKKAANNGTELCNI